jgi:hypothetical protein
MRSRRISKSGFLFKIPIRSKPTASINAAINNTSSHLLSFLKINFIVSLIFKTPNMMRHIAVKISGSLYSFGAGREKTA